MGDERNIRASLLSQNEMDDIHFLLPGQGFVRVRSATSFVQTRWKCHRILLLSQHSLAPRLAPEIRLEIWHLAVLEPRILELELLEDGQWHSSTPCSAIIPSNPHACHESRQEALKTYQRLSFGVWSRSISSISDTFSIIVGLILTTRESFWNYCRPNRYSKSSVSSPYGLNLWS